MAKIDDSVKKKVPELRFKGFTDDWEERKLSDIADRFDNLRVPITASDRKPGDTPYYGANGIQDYVEGFTHNGEFILVAEDGANDLKNYPVQYVNGKVWVNNHAHVLQGKKTITDNKFLMNAIKNFNIEPFLVGGGRAKLNADVMMKLNILLPTFVEQEKIGSLFSLLDKTIALHQRKLDLLKEQKKGFLQKMFPKNGAKIPELRFEGFSDDWEERKLGEITEYIKGFAFKSKDYKKSGYRIIRVSDLGKESIKNSNDSIFTSEEIAIQQKKYKIKQDEIIITTVGSKAEMKESAVGRPIIISESLGYLLNQNLVKIYGKENYSNYFIYSQLLQPRYSDYISMIQRGNANQANIAINDLWEFQILIPEIEEQQKIGSFFKHLDDTIALHQRKLDLLKKQKKGLLQKMFV